MPLLRNAEAGTYMVTHPLPAITRACAGENIKAGLKPVIPPLGDLNGFMHGMVRGTDAIHHTLFALSRPVCMEFHHGAVWLDGVSAIDLDLIVILSDQLNWAQACRCNNKQNQLCDHFPSWQKYAQKIGYRRLPR